LARFSLSKVPPRRFTEVRSEELVGNPSWGKDGWRFNAPRGSEKIIVFSPVERE